MFSRIVGRLVAVALPHPPVYDAWSNPKLLIDLLKMLYIWCTHIDVPGMVRNAIEATHDTSAATNQ